jgi:hypothetical protein
MRLKSTTPIVRAALAACAVLTFAAFAGKNASASSPAFAPAFARAAAAVYPPTALATPLAWPQYGRDPGHSGNNPSETTLSPKNVANLTQLWSFAPNQNYSLTQGIVLADGLLYAEINNLLFAIKADTGKAAWMATTGSAAYGPVVVDGLVVSPCSGSSICGFAAKTGKPVYSQNCNTSGCGNVSSPGVADGLLYYEWSSGTNYYEAEEPTSGKVVWQTTTGNHCPNNGNGTPAPVLNGSAFYELGCQGSDGHTSVCAFNAKSGAPGWCYEVAAGCGNASTLGMSAAEDTVFANVQSSSCNEQIVALDAKTGAPKWAYTTGSGNTLGTGAPAVANGVMYEYVSGSGLQAFSVKTGKLLWTQPDAVGNFSVSVANGVVYGACNVGSGTTNCAMAATTGAVLWAEPGSNGGNTTPIVVNGVLYLGCANVNFCAYGLPAKRR